MTIAKTLKHIRTEKGLTGEEVSQKIGISATNIRRYETGERTPGQEQVVKLCKIFEVSSFLLDPTNYGYIKLETKGDLIALIIEGIKRGLITVVDTNKNGLSLEINPVIAQFFKKTLAPVISDVQIAEAVKHWNDEWTIDYLAHRDVNTEEIQQYQLDDLAKKQISFAIMYTEPIK